MIGSGQKITLREDPLEITTREIETRAETLREDDRSVEAVIATETMARVFDVDESFDIVDEILLADGFEAAPAVALLENHRRQSLDDQFGSVRDFKTEGRSVVARLYFAESIEGDPESQRVERAFLKVKGGHVRGVSAGYRVIERQWIEPNSSAVIHGREYRASDRRLRVVTRWLVREVSLTPIGADQFATIRSQHHLRGAATMPKKLREYLESIGLRSEATEADAWQNYHDLAQTERSHADTLIGDDVSIPADTTRADPPTDPPADPLADLLANTIRTDDVGAITQRAIADERQRVSDLRTLFADDAPELLERTISEGTSRDDAASLLLVEIRTRSSSVSAGGPGIHSRGSGDTNERTLQAGLMARNGVAIDRQFSQETIAGSGLPTWLGQDVNNNERQQIMEFGYRNASLPLVEVCRAALRLGNRNVPHNQDLMVRAAMSTSELLSIFTTSVNASTMSGYEDSVDSTVGWCSEADVADFKTNDRIAVTKFGRLKRHARGGTAEHLATADEIESYKIGRYSGQFVVDEMDIIDDSFGAIEQMSPSDMGSSARQLRPDIVYGILLANANMRDSAALFVAGHSNLQTGALGATTLQTTLVAMGKQRIAGRPINVRGAYLVVPQDLKFDAAVLLRSVTRNEDGTDGNYNPLMNEGLTLRADDRIGVAGVTDPVDDTARVGTATNYFVIAQPGASGARTIEVGYRRGTGRVPTVRASVLTQGQWGISWDVNLDIGGKALDWRGMQKSTGA